MRAWRALTFRRGEILDLALVLILIQRSLPYILFVRSRFSLALSLS